MYGTYVYHQHTKVPQYSTRKQPDTYKGKTLNQNLLFTYIILYYTLHIALFSHKETGQKGGTRTLFDGYTFLSRLSFHFSSFDSLVYVCTRARDQIPHRYRIY